MEQTSNSTLPWFAALELKGFVPRIKKTEAEIRRAIQGGADRLLSMQTPSGGLAYWCGGPEPNLWASTLGGSVLVLAKQHGAEIPDVSIQKLGSWLAEQLRGLPDMKEPGELQERAASLYALALTGKSDPGYLAKMIDRRQELSVAARSYLALAILASGGDKSQARELLTAPAGKAGNQSWRWFDYDYTAAMRLLAWCHLDPAAAETNVLLEQMLAKRGKRGDWSNTFCNGWALNALGAYAKLAENRQSTLLTLEGAVAKTLNFDLMSPSAFFDLEGKEGPMRLTAKDSVGMRLHGYVKLTGQPPLETAAVAKGFHIQREYHKLGADGKPEPLGEPRVGDLARVTLSVEAPNADYVVVDDPLPSVFEAINEDFASQGSGARGEPGRGYSWWSSSHQEMRDDRALFFCDRLWGGKYQISYLARVTGVGAATAPPAKIEAMYEPQRYGLSASARLATREREGMDIKTAER